MRRRVLVLLSLTCAVGVGNLYFPQAITPLIAAALDEPVGTTALLVTATQAGYTVGIFLLVPLGDRYPHRPLIVALSALTAGALLAAACAPALPHLVAAGAVVGVSTVAAQLVAPLAAGLVADDRRGAVMGTLLSGSIAGMLLSRTVGAVVAEHLGWRAPYLAAACVVALLAVALGLTLPTTAPTDPPPYRTLLRGPLRLLRHEPALRRSCVYQACVFGGFSAVWTCLALQLGGPRYGLGTTAIGLVALVGVSTAACTPLAGRVVDRRGADHVNLVCFTGVLVAVALLLLGDLGGAPGLTALVVGVSVLDAAMQSGMVANQTRVLAIDPGARSRLNTAYMTCAYLGGAAGSGLGTVAFDVGGWTGVCVLVAVLTSVPLVLHLAMSGGRAGENAGGPGTARNAP